ncbi:MAG: NUDIX domain-containing protein [Patescibacteria group bacterium]
MNTTSKYYSAAAIFEKRGGVWGVYAVTVPGRAEMKFPGGSSNDSLNEDPNETLERELLEELKIRLRVSPCFFVDPKPSDDPGAPDHLKHFFILEKYDGTLCEGMFVDDQTVKKLEWVTLDVFHKRSFHHHEAFCRSLVAMSEESKVFERETHKFRRSLALI